MSGSNIFLLNQSTNDYEASSPYFNSTVDVAEMGGPRSIVRQNADAPLSSDSTITILSEMFNARVRVIFIVPVRSSQATCIIPESTLYRG